MNTLASDLLCRRGFAGLKLKPPSRTLDKNARAIRYLKTGGLPGTCFVRNDRDRNDLIESQINLILDRDLRLVCETSLPLSSLKTLIRHLAFLQNTPLNLAELARKTRISVPTLRKIIVGLEAVFFIRMVPCEGDEVRPVLFFEDQGEASYLCSQRLASEAGSAAYPVADLERLVFAHVRIPFAYAAGIPWELSQYRQQGGAYVPFVLRASNKILGLICMAESFPSLGALRSAASFLKKNGHAKIIYLHPGNNLDVINDRELVLPIEMVL